MTPSSNHTRSENGHIQDRTIVEPIKQDLNSVLRQGVSSESILSMLRHQSQVQAILPPPPTTSLPPHPVFPDLSPNNEMPMMSVAEIAREAMRLTKETLRNEGKKEGSWTIQTDLLHVVERKNEQATPLNLKTDESLSSTSEDDAAPIDISKKSTSTKSAGGLRLNKFVRRLHDMLVQEKDNGIVEWRRGLLVLHNTEVFAKCVLPKYFNTRNFKTFRRQLNYYAFIHVRSFSNSGGSSTTALWVNKGLAETAQQQGADPEDIATVLLLKRAEACDTARTVEGRRVRKKLAISVVEEDYGVATKSLQQVQSTRRINKSEQIRKAVSAPLNTYHFQTKHGLVLEHYNHNTATFSKIIPSPTSPKEIRLSNYTDHHHINDIHQHCGSPERTVSTSNGEDYQQLDVPKVSLRPPTSSASAANLLLLLSKTQ